MQEQGNTGIPPCVVSDTKSTLPSLKTFCSPSMHQRITSCLGVFLLLLGSAAAQDFYAEANGNYITIKCEGASVGEVGVVFGVEVIAVDNQTIRSYVDTGHDMSRICTTHVTSMWMLFFYKTNFNDNIGSWDVSNVTNMESMFSNAVNFNQDIRGWNVSSVSNMESMFHWADRFSYDLSGWCVPHIPSRPAWFADQSPLYLQPSLHPNWGCNVAPESDLRASITSGLAPLEVQFTAAFSTDVNGDDLSFEWDLGDGYTVEGANITHTYPQGDYSITLIVSDGELSDTSSVAISSLNAAPIIDLQTSDLEGLSPLEVSFDADTTSDANGDSLSFSWDFGGGDTSTASQAVRVFEAGQYEVTLMVTDGMEAVSQSITVTSVNYAPVPAIVASASLGQAPFEVTLDGSATSDANGDAMTFDWDLGDGTTSTDTTVTHTYTAAGEYNVVLTVFDGLESASDSVTVSIASGVATEAAESPESYELRPAYPNPFNSTTTLSYALPQASEVRITVTDLLGRHVAELVAKAVKPAGYHMVNFDAGSLSSGMYLVTMEAVEFVTTQELILAR